MSTSGYRPQYDTTGNTKQVKVKTWHRDGIDWDYFNHPEQWSGFEDAERVKVLLRTCEQHLEQCVWVQHALDAGRNDVWHRLLNIGMASISWDFKPGPTLIVKDRPALGIRDAEPEAWWDWLNLGAVTTTRPEGDDALL